MNGLHPIMAKALAPWMPPIDDPRDLLLLEEDDDLNPDEPDADDSICPTCSGSGEGRYEGSTCHACNGSGVHHE